MIKVVGIVLAAVLTLLVIIAGTLGAVLGALTGTSTPTPTCDPDPAAFPGAQPGPVIPSRSELLPLPISTPQRHLDLTTPQLANATIIVAVGEAHHLPPRAWVIALAAALQESGLRNLDHGDRDSLGLFQQRPSQHWGTPAQITDPAYAADRFYTALQTLITHDPSWQTRPLTQLAQAVQHSGAPTAYAPWEQQAADTVLAVYGAAPLCPPPPSTSSPSEATRPDIPGRPLPAPVVNTDLTP